MSSQTDQRQDYISLLMGGLAVTFLTWLCSEKFTDVERLVANNLLGMSASGPQLLPGATADSTVEIGVRIFAAAIFACASMLATYKISPHSQISAGKIKLSVRLLVLVQLLALNVVLHFLLAMNHVHLLMLISLTLCSSLGAAYGALIRRSKDLQSKLEVRNAALDLSESDLKSLMLQVVKEDEIERRVLAGDLHDQVLNDLKLIRERMLEFVRSTQLKRKKTSSGDSPEQAIDELLVNAMQEIREVMDSLSPAVLQHLGFVEAIEDCIRRGAERSGYKVRFRCNVDPREFNALTAIELSLLYRLVQETVTNICKHSKATIVKCVITVDSGVLILSINDNGVGFDKEKVAGETRGMRYMKTRAAIIGAGVAWLAGDEGKGTKVQISLKKPIE